MAHNPQVIRCVYRLCPILAQTCTLFLSPPILHTMTKTFLHCWRWCLLPCVNVRKLNADPSLRFATLLSFESFISYPPTNSTNQCNIDDDKDIIVFFWICTMKTIFEETKVNYTDWIIVYFFTYIYIVKWHHFNHNHYFVRLEFRSHSVDDDKLAFKPKY